ncbi:PstS family phosphate ABC transporter substrate-binding protein [Chroococcus sp. FPU101]|uniref:PstS family phosphate ABC transporter substrate-binding protein n=1 Tax=Chroococcus sp. FPU101 TaxID=1974212 RepID=UPI001A8F78FF|nr:PstS family phosphate ABC transporter substrate-binding protein [Chroococcus sp. FPU101]GFE70502.1 phosphate binding protein [Chroococcus sp. FPU101]
MKSTSKKNSLIIKTGVIATLLLQSCASTNPKDVKPIKIDGSSTVYPITQKVLEHYKANPPKQTLSDITVNDNFSGTGGGFKKFCDGQTDINAASRPISKEEMAACNAKEIRYIELPIAFDALTVAVNAKNTWASDITVAELKKLWEPSAQGKITKWNQIRSTWPDQPITLHGAGQDSGTFDYFTEAIVGQPSASRTDYNYSEDDQALVNAVKQDTNALGYFGYSYYEQNKDQLKALAINNGNNAVLPSAESVKTSQYQPLARPLFIYVNAKAAQDNPALETFVKYYLNHAPQAVAEVGYIPLPDEGYHIAKVQFEKFEAGTVFDGKAQYNLTIGELLRKQAQFETANK